ncbi:MAG: InlB B-repeat-containing protein [Clostridia bacterium]|nr:InlB B-repeat-containing protein [Clostridia bacterium]
MKKLLALLLAVIMVALCVPVTALETEDWDPTGQNISAVNAAYFTAGGNPSSTDFFTMDDIASHRLTIINVWSDGCGPCLNEMPYFQQVHENYADQGVLVVGVGSLWISGSYSGEWSVLQNNGYTYMNVIQDNVLKSLYSHNGYLPQTFFVNDQGVVIDFIGGGTTYNTLVSKINYWFNVFDSDEYYDVTFAIQKNYPSDSEPIVFETQSVHVGYTPVYPEPPEVEGYSFDGWDPASPPVVTNGPVTVYAKYKVLPPFRVRFYDSITGDLLLTKNVLYGNPVTPPEAPEHEGYVFMGWDQDLSFVSHAMDVYTIYSPEGGFLPGDADGNGVITSADALAILRYTMGTGTIPESLLAYCDVDYNGSVTSADALAVLRIAMGL